MVVVYPLLNFPIVFRVTWVPFVLSFPLNQAPLSRFLLSRVWLEVSTLFRLATDTINYDLSTRPELVSTLNPETFLKYADIECFIRGFTWFPLHIDWMGGYTQG
jgi:hypothetical protein